MLDSVYIGLTGLIGFSRDLSVIGNNVANLNTPGFKGSQLLFTDLFYRSQLSDNNTDGSSARLDLGSGVSTGSTRLLFSQGEVKSSGNPQDAAITGNGFFVVKRDDQTFYTRAGQFGFDAEGFLVSESQKARVQSLAGGGLRDINILGLRTNAGQATTRVAFNGILDTSSTDTPVVVSAINVFDAAGVGHALSATFTNNRLVTAGSWLVEIKDPAGALVASGDIRFNTDGTPAVGFNSLSVPLNGDAAASVEFFFGDPGSAAGVRALSASASSVAVGSQDGFGIGSLIDTAFDNTGTLTLTYSNGRTAKGPQLALASFNYLQGLQQIQGSLLQPGNGEEPVLGHAREGAFGSITGGSIELANIDLAQQFSDLIISQRGYQASSQVISTANDLIQQLFDMKARR
jgi:flagellar hook protein FlgE